MEAKTKFRTVRISQIGRIVTGHTPPRKIKEYFGNKTTWIKPTDIEIGSRYIGKTEEKFSEKAHEKYIDSLLPALSTCVVTIGTVGEKICLTKENSFTNQAINSIITNESEFDPMFVFYLLKYNLHLVELRHSGTASGRHNISKSGFSSIKLKVPDLPSQKIIAWVISKYDDLLEINIKRIELLEQISELIYYEWFIKFKFPGYEKIDMFDSELGAIPEGWKIKRIDDFGEVVTGKTPPTKIAENYGDYMSFIKTPDMHNNVYCIESEQRLSERGVLTQKKKTLPPNSIMISCIGTIGVVSITAFDSQTNQQINSIKLKKAYYLEYLFFTLKKLKPHLENLGATGATMGNVNKGKFESIEIIFPDDDIMQSFSNIVSPIFIQIKKLQLDNKNLRNTRDILISEMISGEINVLNLKIQLPK